MTLIDSDEWTNALDSARFNWEQSGLLPDLYAGEWPSLVGYFAMLPRIAHPTSDEVLESLPAHDPTDPLQRSLVASILLRLRQEAEGERLVESALGLTRLLQDYLAVANQPLTTLRDVRWEIHAALAAHDLRRMISCCRRWLELDSQAETLTICVETAFAALCQVEELAFATDPQWAPSNPREDGSGEGLAGLRLTTQLFLYSWATLLHPKDPLDPDRGRLPRDRDNGEISIPLDQWSGEPVEQTRRERRELVEIAAMLLRKLGPDRSTRKPYLAALSAWCEFVDGVCEQNKAAVELAAIRYAEIDTGTDSRGQISAIRAAVGCYEYLGRFEKAKEQVRRWIALAPDDADPQKKLVEILYKEEQLPEALEAFEAYVRLKADDPGGDWLDSLTLRLGCEFRQHRRILLQSAADQARWAPAGRRLAIWYHPWFDGLCPEAARRWWHGLYAVASPEYCENVGEQTVWETAADAFGEAVAMELRHSVFRPFLRDHPVAPRASSAPNEWDAVLRDRATLGQMLVGLQHAKNRIGPGRQLAVWLQQHKPALLNYLGLRREQDLMRLNRLRGQAQHNTVTEAEARQVFDDAAGLLRHVISG